jgi:peptidoglycan/LPS O-acetylase OafA/YrhL
MGCIGVEPERHLAVGRSKLDSLTGLRGIAALAVVCNHYFAWCAPFDTQTAPPWLWRVLGLGGLGMSVFFTLSGFVIAYNYARLDWARSAAVTEFAWLRFSRLYPALLLFIALTAVRHGPRIELGEHFPAISLLTLLSAESLFPIKINGHLIIESGYNLSWSISTEIGLYAGFALCMIALRKAQQRWGARATSWAVVLAGCYLLGMAALMWMPEAADRVLSKLPEAVEPLTRADRIRWFFYVSPYCRFYDFLFGCVAATLAARGGRQVGWVAIAGGAGMVLLYAAVWFTNAPHFLTVQLLSAPLLAAVMASAGRANRINWLLSASILMLIGEISYSLYLFHPFVAAVVWWLRGGPGSGAFSWIGFGEFAVIGSATLLAAIAVAYLLHRSLEIPAQRWLRGLSGALRAYPARPRASSGPPVAHKPR